MAKKKIYARLENKGSQYVGYMFSFGLCPTCTLKGCYMEGGMTQCSRHPLALEVPGVEHP